MAKQYNQGNFLKQTFNSSYSFRVFGARDSRAKAWRQKELRVHIVIHKQKAESTLEVAQVLKLQSPPQRHTSQKRSHLLV